MKAAILCGGKATRLGWKTKGTPKSLIKVAGEPFIFHQLRLLRDNGFKDIVLCIGHLGEMIRATVVKGYGVGVNVEYSEDGDIPLGTGGALKKALPLLGTEFLVMYGDSYLPINYEPIVEAFTQSRKWALLTLFNGIDYGLGIFNSDAFTALSGHYNFDLAEVYRRMDWLKQLVKYEVHERFYEIGSEEGLAEVRRKLAIATD